MKSRVGTEVRSKRLTERLASWSRDGKIRHLARAYRAGDLTGYQLAFVATDDGRVNLAVAAEGRARGTWVNAADDPAHCDFILPSVLRRRRACRGGGDWRYRPGLVAVKVSRVSSPRFTVKESTRPGYGLNEKAFMALVPVRIGGKNMKRWAIGVQILGVLVISAICVSGSGAAEPYKLKLPPGLQEQAAYIPADNPLTAEKIELGKQLYFDRRLSADGTVSCATCHAPDKGFSDGRPTSRGIEGQVGGRNAPVTINRLFSQEQFWDGRAASLEDQALGPVQNPIEMGNTLDGMVATLKKIKGYRGQFRKVFGTDVSKEGVAKAIASFERTLLCGNSAFDKFEAGDTNALSESARRGLALFRGEVKCLTCHAGFNFTDENYHNVGVGMDKPNPDLGRYRVTKREQDRGAFKTSTLRNVTASGPYFHDGSARTLAWKIHER
ncbi:MAG: cytochrome c peroxidase [Candidatus Rokuibacteriota bacterium]